MLIRNTNIMNGTLHMPTIYTIFTTILRAKSVNLQRKFVLYDSLYDVLTLHSHSISNSVQTTNDRQYDHEFCGNYYCFNSNLMLFST